jgi:hypothetical protein
MPGRGSAKRPLTRHSRLAEWLKTCRLVHQTEQNLLLVRHFVAGTDAADEIGCQ